MAVLDEVREIIRNAKSVVFFGGAGVSTDSGIPDFRGSGGLYTSDDEYGASPENIISHSSLMYNPERFYKYYKNNMVYPYAEPNLAHTALAALEKTGKLKAVITQNIDGLHQAGGSSEVIELHGSVHKNYCIRCGKEHSLSYVLDADGVPYCTACGALVRPDVVLYGEGLDTESFTRAEDMVYEADVLIVGGTSLTVHPACSLVDAFEGENLIIINKSPTPYDEYAQYVIRDSISDVLCEIVEGL